MVSDPLAYNIAQGNTSVVADDLLLYEYKPKVVDGRSENAFELFTSFVDVPEISDQNRELNVNTNIERNVAKVNLIIKDVSGGINFQSLQNKIYLHNVPSKISYTGLFLPSVASPDTLTSPLFSKLSFNLGSDVTAETVTFIIPANKDIASTSSSLHKMNISVVLERTDGSFLKQHAK